MSIVNQDGTPDTQAGSHPFAYSTTLTLKRANEGIPVYSEGGDAHDIEVELPPGLVGDPGVVPACPATEFTGKVVGYFGDSHPCPDDTQIGVIELNLSGFMLNEPVYNLAPVKGTPAEFGFIAFTSPVVLIPHVRTGSDYGVSVQFSNLPDAFSLVQGR